MVSLHFLLVLIALFSSAFAGVISRLEDEHPIGEENLEVERPHDGEQHAHEDGNAAVRLRCNLEAKPNAQFEEKHCENFDGQSEGERLEKSGQGSENQEMRTGEEETLHAGQPEMINEEHGIIQTGESVHNPESVYKPIEPVVRAEEPIRPY